MLAQGITCLTATYWTYRYNWRYCVIISAIIYGIANYLCIGETDFTTLMVLRMVAGFFAGAIVLIAVAGIADSRNPDRNFAMALVVQGTFGGLLLWFADPILEAFGEDSLYTVLILPLILSIVAIKALPVGCSHSSVDDEGHIQEHDEKSSISPLYIYSIYLGIVLFFMGMNGFWTFSELIGAELGIEGSVIGEILTYSLIVSVISALVAAKMGGIARLNPIVFGNAVAILSLLLLVVDPSYWMFVIAVNVVQFGYNFGIPFQSGWANRLDDNGRKIFLLPFFQSVGLSLGSALSGEVVSGDSYMNVMYFCSAMLLLSCVVFWATKKMQNNRIAVDDTTGKYVKASSLAETTS